MADRAPIPDPGNRPASVAGDAAPTLLDLAAYVDDRLAPAERRQVEQWLAADPDAALLLPEEEEKVPVSARQVGMNVPPAVIERAQALVAAPSLVERSSRWTIQSWLAAGRWGVAAAAAILISAIGYHAGMTASPGQQDDTFLAEVSFGTIAPEDESAAADDALLLALLDDAEATP